jgi:micrococcal nuclease
LVEGKKVHLEKDVSEKDVYGRLLRYVWVSSSVDNDNKIFVNNYLVKEGYAHEASYPPDVKYQEQFLQAQNEARTQNKGLWSKCQSSIQTNKNK